MGWYLAQNATPIDIGRGLSVYVCGIGWVISELRQREDLLTPELVHVLMYARSSRIESRKVRLQTRTRL